MRIQQDEKDVMDLYLRTGVVPQKYLERVLGDQRLGICVIPMDLQPSIWLVEMQNFYESHGFYRSEDLKKLLGDSVEVVSGNEEEARRRFLRKI